LTHKQCFSPTGCASDCAEEEEGEDERVDKSWEDPRLKPIG
jgi:hypothetical protein